MSLERFCQLSEKANAQRVEVAPIFNPHYSTFCFCHQQAQKNPTNYQEALRTCLSRYVDQWDIPVAGTQESIDRLKLEFPEFTLKTWKGDFPTVSDR